MLDTDSTLGTTLWCTANGAAGPGAISWYDHHLRPDPNGGEDSWPWGFIMLFCSLF